MPLLTREDESNEYAPRTWPFWRNLAVYFCVFSVVGHWLEIVYCSFMDLFGIVADDSLVWDDPFYPFLVYGIGVAVCVVALIPLKEWLIRRSRGMVDAGVLFYVATVVICMLMELAMGLMLNQPNAAGEYPLWDNSNFVLSLFDQTWLVNDMALGGVAMLYTWIIYPLSEKVLAKVPGRVMNAASVLMVAGFVALCVVKFS